MSTAEGSVHVRHESKFTRENSMSRSTLFKHSNVEKVIKMELRNCEQCTSTNISVEYIKVQDLMHCICTRCNYEWVE